MTYTIRSVALLAAVSAMTPALCAGAADPPAPTTAGPAREIAVPVLQVIVSEIFTGRVTQIVDSRTLTVRRDDDHGGALPRDISVRLFGVSSLDGSGGNARALDFLNQNLKNQKVEITVRRRDPKGGADALVRTVDASSTRPMRLLDATGASSDMPHGVGRPLLPPERFRQPVNFVLIRNGLARYDPRFAALDRDTTRQLAEAEQDARREKQGVWAEIAKEVGTSAVGSATSAEKRRASPK